MASGEVLKEYLVDLGFNVDESSLKKWGAALGGTAGQVLKFTAEVTAAAAATFEFVNVVSKRMEDLYWATQRIGSSANNIQSYELAIKKMGGTAEGARATLEGFAQLLRTNPASEAFVHALGVNTRDANGNLRDTVAVLGDLGQRFKQMPYWIANKWAQKLGIDEDTLWRMTHGLDKFGDEYGKLYKKFGIDPQAATKAAKDFQNQLEDLKAEFDVLEIVLEANLLPYMRQLVGWLDQLIKYAEHGADKTTDLGKALGNLSVAGEDLKGLAKTVETIGDAALKLIGSMPPEALEFGIIGYFLFGKKAALILGIAGAISHLVDQLTGDTKDKKPSNDLINRIGKGQDQDSKNARWMIDHGFGYFIKNEVNTAYDEYKKRNAKKTAPSSTQGDGLPHNQDPYQPGTDDLPIGSKAPVGVRNNNPGNLKSWGNAERGEGGFVHFDDAVTGISAMAGQLQRYGQRGMDSISKMISTYAPSDDRNDVPAYINDVAKRSGFDPQSHLNLNDPEVLNKIIAAMIRHENGFEPYTSGTINAGVQQRLRVGLPNATLRGDASQKNVTIHQNNTYTISGASDPKAVGKAVSDEQGRVNGDLVRDTKAALF